MLKTKNFGRVSRELKEILESRSSSWDEGRPDPTEGELSFALGRPCVSNVIQTRRQTPYGVKPYKLTLNNTTT